MSYLRLALGVMGLLAANAAHANVLFDSVTQIPSMGFTGPADGSNTFIMGASFAAATPDFTRISLEIGVGSTNTSGSTMIYLVPDDGSGEGNGIPGLPIMENPDGTFKNFIGSQLIGTVLDKSLSSTLSLVSFSVHPTVVSNDGEYWVVAQSNSASSFEWSYANSDAGVGVAGQQFLNDSQDNNGVASNLLPSDNGGGAYQMVVDTPEPATMAILGAGLATLGLVRRRKAKSD